MSLALSEKLGPDLPTVSRLSKAARQAGLVFPSNVMLIGVQHVLGTNVTLFESLIELGLLPQHIYLLGKGYSTSLNSLQALRASQINAFSDLALPLPGGYEEAREAELREFWRAAKTVLNRRGIESVLIPDVGGRLLAIAEDDAADLHARCRVAGIELTTSGIRRLEMRPRLFPIVNVAQAAAKTRHESPLVADTIISKLNSGSSRLKRGMAVGVIGLGDIGQAIVRNLLARGFDVIATDLGDGEGLASDVEVSPLLDLVVRSDVIFGCTGKDIFEGVGFPPVHRAGVMLCSCSSEDIEFRTLLKGAAGGASTGWPAPDVEILGKCGPITIINGGYPLNFDASEISVPDLDIQVTTALMLAGILTAVKLCELSGPQVPLEFIQLPAALQAAILRDWQKLSRDGSPTVKEVKLSATAERLSAASGGRSFSDQAMFDMAARFLDETEMEHVLQRSQSKAVP